MSMPSAHCAGCLNITNTMAFGAMARFWRCFWVEDQRALRSGFRRKRGADTAACAATTKRERNENRWWAIFIPFLLHAYEVTQDEVPQETGLFCNNRQIDAMAVIVGHKANADLISRLIVGWVTVIAGANLGIASQCAANCHIGAHQCFQRD